MTPLQRVLRRSTKAPLQRCDSSDPMKPRRRQPKVGKALDTRDAPHVASLRLPEECGEQAACEKQGPRGKRDESGSLPEHGRQDEWEKQVECVEQGARVKREKDAECVEEVEEETRSSQRSRKGGAIKFPPSRPLPAEQAPRESLVAKVPARRPRHRDGSPGTTRQLPSGPWASETPASSIVWAEQPEAASGRRSEIHRNRRSIRLDSGAKHTPAETWLSVATSTRDAPAAGSPAGNGSPETPRSRMLAGPATELPNKRAWHGISKRQPPMNCWILISPVGVLVLEFDLRPVLRHENPRRRRTSVPMTVGIAV
jgi:hypothetical protein